MATSMLASVMGIATTIGTATGRVSILLVILVAATVLPIITGAAQAVPHRARVRAKQLKNVAYVSFTMAPQGSFNVDE